MKKKILQLTLIALLIISYGMVSHAQNNPNEPLMNFQRVISLVKSRYIQEVSSKTMVHAGINAMLEKLDPHSNFLDEKAYEKMRDDHAGSFGGLGIVITIRDEILTIVAPIEGTPAYRIGLTAGDRIIKIEGESTEGMTTQDAVELMRGEIGTPVTVTIERDEWGEPKDFTIIRGKIPVESVPYAFEIRPGVGYIRTTRFSQTVAKEFTEALQELEAENIESLILDLRGNPGGYLEQAVAMVENFIDPNEMVVYTDGRMPGSSRDHRSRFRGQKPLKDYPLMVLVNEGSASASEIVSGALQDWDRALIVGETTFGKGLVQNLFPRRGEPLYSNCEDCRLKLTVAKYYTPSGRCIQRPYKGLDVWSYRDPQFKKENEMDFLEEQQTFETFGGREVKAGGGITPDIEIKAEKLTKLMVQIEQNGYFAKFALKMFEESDVPQSVEEIHKNIDKYIEDFKNYLTEVELDYKEDDFSENMESVKRGIKREMVREYWSENANYHIAREEAYKIAIEGDTQILKALEYMENAKELITIKE